MIATTPLRRCTPLALIIIINNNNTTNNNNRYYKKKTSRGPAGEIHASTIINVIPGVQASPPTRPTSSCGCHHATWIRTWAWPRTWPRVRPMVVWCTVQRS